MTPHQTVCNQEPGISNLCQFQLYERFYYREETAKFLFPSQVLGRVLGPSEKIGNEMAMWILRVDGQIIARQTARPLTDEELNSPLEKARRKVFDIEVVLPHQDKQQHAVVLKRHLRKQIEVRLGNEIQTQSSTLQYMTSDSRMVWLNNMPQISLQRIYILRWMWMAM